MFTFLGVLCLTIAIAAYIIKGYNKHAEQENKDIVIFNQNAKAYEHKSSKFIMPNINRPWIILSVGILFLLFSSANPFSMNDAGNRQAVQTLKGNLSMRFDPGLYWVGPFSKVTTYPNNVTIQLGPEDKRSAEADYWGPSHTGTFAEGDQATLGHTVKWDLPNDAINMIKIHKTYQNIDNLATTTLMQYQKETASYSAQRLSSEAHYSGGQSQLKDYFQDQLRNGQVLLVTETKTRKLEDGTEKQYIEVSEQLDSKGMVKRTESDIQDYNIIASFASVDFVQYDERIYKKLEEKIDAASDEATAKQQLITAQQEALTEKAKGEKLIAETKAREESAKLEAVIRAQKEAQVAEENLKRDKFKAASDLALKKAQAEGDRLKVAAGLTPKEKADIEMQTAIGVAKALAGPNGIKFPSIVAGSSGEGGGALQTLQLKMMHELSKSMSSKKIN